MPGTRLNVNAIPVAVISTAAHLTSDSPVTRCQIAEQAIMIPA